MSVMSVVSDLSSDRSSEIEDDVTHEKIDVQPQAPVTAPKRRRFHLFSCLFFVICICLIPVIIVPAVLYTRENAPRSQANSRLAQGASIKSRSDRAQAVKDAFNHAWGGYMNHAFPHDQLLPMSRTFSDPQSAWGSTAVDSLSTAIIMNLPGPVGTMLQHIADTDFTHSNEDISVFETNIRYLGGMLSAYDLLSGPFAQVPHVPALRDNLLVQSKKLADLLSIAFKTPSGIPDNTIRFDGANPVLNGSTRANLAEMGSLVLEWTRLSNLLNDPKYAKLTQRAQEYVLKPTPPSSEPFPGLIGSYISIEDGSSVASNGGWGGGSDSFYEYLIKAYVYDPKQYESYKDRWVKAADSSMMYLSSHPSTNTDLTFLAGFDGTKGIPEAGHLSCFAGGNFILGGQVLNQQKYVDFGLNLTSSCHQTYQSTETRIGPETFSWVPQECGLGVNNRGALDARDELNITTQSSPVPGVAHTTFDCGGKKSGGVISNSKVADTSSSSDKFYKDKGFKITNAQYNLRPEVLESYYYAYRATGNPVYQEWAWDAFNAINTHARLESGFNALGNVNAVGADNKMGNAQESYFFAETLKYAFLIFDVDGEHQVGFNGSNAFVFNTEGHPLRIPPRE